MLISIEMLKDYLTSADMEVTINGTSVFRFKTVRFLRDKYEHITDCLFVRSDISEKTLSVNQCLILSDTFQVVADCGDNTKLFDLIQDCLSYYNDWDDRIRNCLLSNCSLIELLNISRSIFQNPILVDDSSFRTLAMSENYDLSCFQDQESSHMHEHGFHSPEYISKMLASPVFRSINTTPQRAKIYLYDFLAHPNIIASISVENEILGYFTVIGIETKLTQGLVDISEHFAQLLSTILIREKQTNAFKQKSLDNDLIREIIHGRVTDSSLIKTAFTRMGFPDACSFTVAIITLDDFSDGHHLIFHSVVEHFYARLDNSYCVLEENNITLIIRENATLTEMKRVLSFSHEFVFFSRIKLGVSLPCADPLEVSLYYRQALSSIHFGKLISPDCRYCRYDEIIGYDLLESYGDAERRKPLCHPAIGLLAKYDQEKGSVLLPTLRVLLRCQVDTSAAADIMFVHRNSIYYRMNQITSITGLDLHSKVTLEHLAISLRIHDMDE